MSPYTIIHTPRIDWRWIEDNIYIIICMHVLDWTELNWTGLDWTGLDWTGLDWTGMDWTRLDWTSMDWTGLAWTDMDRHGLDWHGMDWHGLAWTVLNFNSKIAHHTQHTTHTKLNWVQYSTLNFWMIPNILWLCGSTATLTKEDAQKS